MVCSSQGWNRGKMVGQSVIGSEPPNLDPKHYCAGKYSLRLGSCDFPLQSYSLSLLLRLFTAVLCVHSTSVYRLKGPHIDLSINLHKIMFQCFHQDFNKGIIILRIHSTYKLGPGIALSVIVLRKTYTYVVFKQTHLSYKCNYILGHQSSLILMHH